MTEWQRSGQEPGKGYSGGWHDTAGGWHDTAGGVAKIRRAPGFATFPRRP